MYSTVKCLESPFFIFWQNNGKIFGLLEGRAKDLCWMLTAFCWVPSRWSYTASIKLSSGLWRRPIHDWYFSIVRFFFSVQVYFLLHWQCVWNHWHTKKMKMLQIRSFPDGIAWQQISAVGNTTYWLWQFYTIFLPSCHNTKGNLCLWLELNCWPFV